MRQIPPRLPHERAITLRKRATVKEVTISDIAKRAGVGKATVSRVLNGSGYVSAETRERVEDAIRDFDYTPSAAARALSRRVGSSIGLVVPEVDNPFFGNIVQGVSQGTDLPIILANTVNSAEQDVKVLRAMLEQRLRGLIYTPAVDYGGHPLEAEVHRMLSQMNAVVVLDRELAGAKFDGVFTDNYEGAYASTRALIEAGHRRIGVVAGDMGLAIGRQRYAGFCKALGDAGLALLPEDVLDARFTAEGAYRETIRMLARPDRPTAFFVSNNLSSKGFIRAVFEKGMRIPEDIAYIGFDRVDGLDLFGLQYSCLDRDVPRMGAMAMRLLLERIDDPGKPRERIVASPVLRLTGSEKRWR